MANKPKAAKGVAKTVKGTASKPKAAKGVAKTVKGTDLLGGAYLSNDVSGAYLSNADIKALAEDRISDDEYSFASYSFPFDSVAETQPVPPPRAADGLSSADVQRLGKGVLVNTKQAIHECIFAMRDVGASKQQPPGSREAPTPRAIEGMLATLTGDHQPKYGPLVRAYARLILSRVPALMREACIGAHAPRENEDVPGVLKGRCNARSRRGRVCTRLPHTSGAHISVAEAADLQTQADGAVAKWIDEKARVTRLAWRELRIARRVRRDAKRAAAAAVLADLGTVELSPVASVAASTPITAVLIDMD